MIASAFHEQLARFPSAAAAILENLKHQNGRLDSEQSQGLMHCLNISWDGLLEALLPLATALTVHPVSHFPVGAIVEGYREIGHGPLYFGANLEMPGLPLKLSVHAEQAAVCNAWHQGETQLRQLIVNDAPCGHCRQFLNELHHAEDIVVTIKRPNSEKVARYFMADLLPDSFGPANLNQNDRLMSSVSTDIQLAEPYIQDALTVAAAEAATNSYAPYTQCYSGVALQLSNGQIITGQYAENVAFNPGMTAVESAIVNWRLANLATPETPVRITDAVLVEKKAMISHQAITENVLSYYRVNLTTIVI